MLLYDVIDFSDSKNALVSINKDMIYHVNYAYTNTV